MTPERRPRRGGGGIRSVALVLVVVLAAVAFATLLRPRHGYTSAHRALIVLALGVAAAVTALIIVAAADALLRRRRHSLWFALTAFPSMSFVLAIFIAAAVAAQVTQAIRSATAGAGDASARADFQRWQQTVVPIVVRWMAAIRDERAFAQGLPQTPLPALRRRVERSQRTLDQLTRSLAADSSGLPQRTDLQRLTEQLQNALSLARQAEASYALALATAVPAGAARSDRAAGTERLIGRGNAAAQRSLEIMRTFSFEANALGGSLFVQQP